MFHHFYMLDWSASSSPKLGKDSIWRCAKDLTTNEVSQPENIATRTEVWDWFTQLVETCEAKGERAVVGFDFAFAYPKGTARALGHQPTDEPAWSFTWSAIEQLLQDGSDNRNNRFAVGARLNETIMSHFNCAQGPFWGIVGREQHKSLSPKKPLNFTDLPEWRGIERMLPGCQPGWKLAYAGSVGGQALVGIAGLQKLRNEGIRFSVWPFEASDNTAVVVAETYPSFWELAVDDHDVKDANQVVQVAHEVTAARLQLWLDRACLPADALAEEGWVLGVSSKDGQ